MLNLVILWLKLPLVLNLLPTIIIIRSRLATCLALSLSGQPMAVVFTCVCAVFLVWPFTSKAVTLKKLIELGVATVPHYLHFRICPGIYSSTFCLTVFLSDCHVYIITLETDENPILEGGALRILRPTIKTITIPLTLQQLVEPLFSL